jgi:hypothetical protein
MAEGLVCLLVIVGAALVPLLVWATGDRARGLGCECERPSPTVIVDANGYRRWCGGCRGELVGHG